MQMDPTTCRGLRGIGFRLLGTVEQLQQLQKGRKGLGNEALQSPGAYAIQCPANYKPSFLPLDKKHMPRNVISPKDHEWLRAKWVEGAEILYFGKAEGQKWQLDRYATFQIFYYPCQSEAQAKEMEARLISEFFRRCNGKLPFGNIQWPRDC